MKERVKSKMIHKLDAIGERLQCYQYEKEGSIGDGERCNNVVLEALRRILRNKPLFNVISTTGELIIETW